MSGFPLREPDPAGFLKKPSRFPGPAPVFPTGKRNQGMAPFQPRVPENTACRFSARADPGKPRTMPGSHPDRHGFSGNRQGFPLPVRFSDGDRWQGTDQFGWNGATGPSAARLTPLRPFPPVQVPDDLPVKMSSLNPPWSHTTGKAIIPGHPTPARDP